MRPRSINIVPVLNGFVVAVGCQTVVVKTPEELGAKITQYYRDPASMEKAEIQAKVNDTLDSAAPLREPPRLMGTDCAAADSERSVPVVRAQG